MFLRTSRTRLHNLVRPGNRLLDAQRPQELFQAGGMADAERVRDRSRRSDRRGLNGLGSDQSGLLGLRGLAGGFLGLLRRVDFAMGTDLQHDYGIRGADAHALASRKVHADLDVLAVNGDFASAVPAEIAAFRHFRFGLGDQQLSIDQNVDGFKRVANRHADFAIGIPALAALFVVTQVACDHTEVADLDIDAALHNITPIGRNT